MPLYVCVAYEESPSEKYSLEKVAIIEAKSNKDAEEVFKKDSIFNSCKEIKDKIIIESFELCDAAVFEYSIQELQEMAEEDIEDFVADFSAPIFS